MTISDSGKFQVHHILPVEVFNNKDVVNGLKKIFGDSYLKLRDGQANKIGLFTDAEQAREAVLAFILDHACLRIRR